MTLFNNKYRVESTRLRTWDYSATGCYFVTICTHQRAFHLGEVVDGDVNLSPMGQTAQQCWADIPSHFPHVSLDAFVVMPNHVHGILLIETTKVETRHVVETRHGASLPHTSNQFGPLKRGSLQAVINAYKAAVTRRCHKNSYTDFKWQSRYYEHVVRNEAALERIRKYVADNPIRWQADRNNPTHLWI